MTFKEIDINEFKQIRGLNYKAGKVQKVINEFSESNIPVAIVEYDEYKNAESCRNSFHQTIKRMKKNNIKIHVINGKVYMINTLLYKEE